MTKLAIDFVGHHRIHFQNLRPIIEVLNRDFECRELMGPNVSPTGASIAVITDHLAFQPLVSSSNYSKLIHVSHDLSDIDVYRKERKQLQYFSLILAPSDVHKSMVTRHIPGVECRVVGWTKDQDRSPRSGGSFDVHYAQEPHVLFAWTDIYSTDWRRILSAASKSKLKFKVKNHVYFEKDLGMAPPGNQRKEYFRYIQELQAMTEFFQENLFPNITLIDPSVNLSSGEFRNDILVTDYSSAALEFARFGISLETGRPSKLKFVGQPKRHRATSSLAKEVRFLSERELIKRLPTMEIEDFSKIPYNPKADYSASDFFPSLEGTSAQVAASEIKALILD